MKQALWILALIAVGLVTASIQLDRQARGKPSMAVIVPEPFRGFAQERIAAQAVAAKDRDLALEASRKLVARRPIPARHIRLLAQAHVLAGEPDAGFLAIQQAGRRGWRDPVAQETILRLAIAAEVQGEAARRFAALLMRPSTEDALLEELGPEALAGDEAQEAFAEILAGSERWQDSFLRRGSRSLPPDLFVSLVASATAQGAQFDCEQIEFAKRPIERKQAGAGERLRQSVAPRC